MVDGAIVVDRDPVYFNHVLSILKKTIPELSESDKKLVDSELDFWGLPLMEYYEKLQQLQHIIDNPPPDIFPEAITRWAAMG